MNILSNTKIYLQCPARCVTGGCELMHQLCFLLRKKGMDAFIIYTPTNHPNPMPNAYAGYNCPWVRNVNDEPQNIMIVPEVGTHYLYSLKYIRRCIWWLSVNNWYSNVFLTAEIVRKSGFTQPVPKFFWFGNDLDLLHFTQSEYARQYLLLNKVDHNRIFPLSDYLNIEFLQRGQNISDAKRKRIVLYNPQKGIDFTEKIIKFAKHIDFYPVKGLNRKGVEELMLNSMCYIDFGEHPGKDRLPRESVVMGLCIITSKNGAAKYKEDIPIPDIYKFDANDFSIPLIVDRINDILNNFYIRRNDFVNYRNLIMQEPFIFNRQIDLIFQKAY